MLKVLRELGLSNTDAEVYFFLATKTPQKAKDVAEALKMKNQRIYSCLKNLQDKGVITCTKERPKVFSTVPIEAAVNSFINANLQEAKQMEENRERILSLWRSIIKRESSR